MRLDKLEVKNYKSIHALQVDFGSLTAIVGKNNFGKSTTLDAIQCFYGEKEISNDDFHLGTSDNIVIKVTFGELNEGDLERSIGYKAMLAKTTAKIKTKPEDEAFVNTQYKKLQDDRDKKIAEYLEKYNIDFESNLPITIVFNCTKEFKISYKINDITITKTDLLKFIPSIKVISAIRTPDKETTAGTKSNLKELISLLQSENTTEDFIDVEGIDDKLSYEEIKTLISQKEEQKCIDLSKDLTKNFQNAINTESLKVKVKIEDSFKFDFKYKTVLEDVEVGREVDILSCGTGLQSMMILSILQTYIKLRKEDNFILLIEEPEVYLHPSLQRKMINTLLNISGKNQTILTTHSPIIISKIDKDNIHCVNKERGVTSLVEASVDNIVSELGIQVSDILNKQAVIFVEGKDDSLLFKKLIDKIALEKEMGANFSERMFDIIQTDGFDKMGFYANAQILHKDTVKSPFWIVTDSDGDEVEERKQVFIDNAHLNGIELQKENFKVLTEYAIESYFLDPTLLSEFLGMEEDKLIHLCQSYFKDYEDALSKYRRKDGTMNKHAFSSKYKPKIMFSNLDKPATAIEHILKANYTGGEEFIDARAQLIEKWNAIENPIASFIDFFEYSRLLESRMNEIIEDLEDIILIVGATIVTA